MPKSVKVRIKCLRHKGIITTEEMNKLIKALEEEQIEVVPHAEWNVNKSYYECSNCKELMLKTQRLYAHCPNCGAKMEKE